MPLETAYTLLLDTGFAQLENEHDVIEIVQRFRKGGEDMDRIDLDLQTLQVFLVI